MGCLDFLCCFKNNNAPASPPPKSELAATAMSASASGDAPAAKTGKVTTYYSLGKVIGSGSYSVVREGVHKHSKDKFAIKCIKRSELTEEDDEAIMTEVAILQQTVTKDDAGLVTTCGTPGYVAPEILEGAPYGKPVDVWSIGVITYILLAGYPPFHDESQPILFRKIRKGKFQYDSPYWDNVSDDAKDFISRMLVVNPKDRATATQLLEHRWILDSDVANVPLTSALTELRRFHARKKFKAAVHSVQATISMNKVLSSSSSSLGSSANDASRNKLHVSDSEVSI
ncbi:hypothetical protein PybrP1_009826 [[Pythium] brassicae (nom. inval.)]|nr:hypothetical protein PybrP1_009826 [[Pythium] brassicae (nom. inval.)]